jgi:excinuclease ABC subunit B
MYADQMTDAMQTAIDETNRRRKKQDDYNKSHGIIPVSITKTVRDITERLSGGESHAVAEGSAAYTVDRKSSSSMAKTELQRVIQELEKQMKQAAKDLEFEKAAALRDQIYELKAILVEESSMTPLQKVKFLSSEDEEE